MNALLLLVALAQPGQAQAVSKDAAFAEGLSALREGDANAAAAAFEEAQAQGARSAGLYHGLGNAWYRAGERGRAITAWRRGQRLEPGNGDLQANLELARKSNIDRLEAPEWRRGPFVWLGWVAPGRVLVVGSLLMGLSLLRGAAATWRKRRGKGMPLPKAAAAAGVLGAVLAASPFVVPQPDTVVVVVEATSARSTITDDGVVLFELHEGVEVERLEGDRGHVLVALPDGRKGWLSEETVLSTDPGAEL